MRKEANSLFYLPSINRFADSEWVIVQDLSAIFNTWRLEQWKQTGRTGYVVDRNDKLWELYYLDEDEESDILEGICWNESFGIKMDRVQY